MKMIKIKGIIFFFLSASLIAQTKAKVVAIKDGDTIVALLEGNIQKTLRLAEVDCPESGQPFGKNAKQFTNSQVFGKEIIFYEINTDRYGRTIAKIYYNNGKYLSAELIKAGLGWWYERYSSNKELKKMQESARKEAVGLWQHKDAVSPYEWRQLNNY